MPIAVIGAAPILSSLVLALSALGLLMFGVFRGPKSLNQVTYGAMIALILGTLAIFGDWFNFSTLLPETLNFADDAFVRFAMVTIYMTTLGVLYGTYRYFDMDKLAQFEYPILVLFSVIGMTIMVSANDLIYFFVGLELQSLSIYVLVAMNRDNAQVSESAVKYFVLGALSTVFILYGMSFIYGFTGTTDLTKAAIHVASMGQLPVALTMALILFLAGLAFKISAAPFHMWTPDVYEGSTTPVTVLIASAPKVAAMAFLVRLLYGPFGLYMDQWQFILQAVAILSMFVGVLTALYQVNIKRLLAYSTISHMGYALVGLSAGTKAGIHSVLIYMVLYVVMTLGTFLTVIQMRRNGHSPTEIRDLKGLSKTNPYMAGTLAVLMFSLAGIPPFAGFFAKLGVLMAAVDSGFYVLAVTAVLASVIGAAYYLRIIKLMYFDESDSEKAGYDTSTSQETNLIIAVSVIVSVLYIVMPNSFLNWASMAANTLFGN